VASDCSLRGTLASPVEVGNGWGDQRINDHSSMGEVSRKRPVESEPNISCQLSHVCVCVVPPTDP